jgi:programmed cell death protein 5
MDELEAIKKRKLEQLQQQAQKQQLEQQKIEQQIMMLENMVKPRLSREALERFGNLKAGQPQLAMQILVVLGQLIQAGKINHVDDNTMLQVLKELQPKKSEIKIIRK